ncbi:MULTISPECIES: amino acid ABC transporter substrate-binding protein [Paenibacillus]|jgi:polar amino acid transport system substrate-binding protein|uniref:Polar amino acid transport system substrate-binding protein n=2 Tax=Paenibacillus barengoltzii TaxID=343517 RepID=R9LBB6_9BACL|nr:MULTISPECIES: amino acid ABC transporter substrate-binding protein [Paenibacillus]EOS55666.1 polar amino acid transport system substrate-binding protein [Paenibacillus barengoltzii G22]MDU0329035.1 amino acid ABC transporter substrate-binding protein [Paenibacillus sp. 3LSP]SME99080.1 polar amino acid transport system substrate-binding protein [Paenibacillus barengoltzii]SMF02059.1 polar amino acid transport system substrate-binding protein [Paenibacillus barengoltzii J12]
MKVNRKMVLMSLVMALVLTMLAGCSGSGAGKEDNQLVIGIDDKFAPMGFRDENNEIVGFDIDYAKAAAEKMGMEATFQPIDWSAKESELNSGRIDLIWNGYTITEERKGKVLFTKPYLKNSQVVVTLADSEITQLSDLAGKTVGLQALSSAADALDAAPIKSEIKTISEFPDNVLALTDLKTKRLDAVVIDEVVARYYMAKEEGTFKLLDESLAPEEYGIGVKKGNEELLNKLQKALDELNQDGTASEISKKWFGEDKVLK